MNIFLDSGIDSTPYNQTMSETSYTSGALAKLVGVSADTLRHYERKGVLARPRRGANGYREYPTEALEWVQLIRRALAVGFTLDELAGILRIRDREDNPCEEVRQLAAIKLQEVDTRLKELRQLRDQLRTVLQGWDARLAERPKGERAHLLKLLPQISKGSTPTIRKGLSPERHKKGNQ